MIVFFIFFFDITNFPNLNVLEFCAHAHVQKETNKHLHITV